MHYCSNTISRKNKKMHEFITVMIVPIAFLSVLLTVRQYLRVRDMDVRLNPSWLEGLNRHA